VSLRCSLLILATTPAGDAYAFVKLTRMVGDAVISHEEEKAVAVAGEFWAA
jgi:hypothetical protein